VGHLRGRRPPARVAGVRRRPEADRADQDLIRRAAQWLRVNPAQSIRAGLADDSDTRALAALLDLLAAELPHLDTALRRQTLESCRVLLGEPTRRPATRRAHSRRGPTTDSGPPL
jgi:hypothetical protein